MKKNKLQVINLFAASPGDALEERNQKTEMVVKELNSGLAEQLGFVIQVKTGDMVPPDAGDAELIILDHIGDYDIFVAIFAERLGTPTKRYASGTVEELHVAIDKRIAGRNQRVMVYFKSPRSAKRGRKHRNEQKRELETFQQQIRSKILFRYFYDANNFEELFRRDLAEVLKLLPDRKPTAQPPASIQLTTTALTDVERKYQCKYWPVWQNAFWSSRPIHWRTEARLFVKARSSIKFLTISGRSIFGAEIDKSLSEQSQFDDFSFKLLLFDWNSPWTKMKMRDERRESDGDIQAAREKAVGIAKSFLAWASNSRLKLHIKLYKEYPVWRMIILDTETAYVGYYPPGKRGYEGPMFIFDRKDESGLFYPVNQYFDRLWASSGNPLSGPDDRRFKLCPFEELR